MAEPHTHLDLLAAARALQHVAAEDDLDELHGELCRLHTSLVEHIHSEEQSNELLSPGAQRLVEQGQRRLLRFVSELLSNSGDDGGDCNCTVRVAGLHGVILRQARLESNLLPTAPTGPR